MTLAFLNVVSSVMGLAHTFFLASFVQDDPDALFTLKLLIQPI